MTSERTTAALMVSLLSPRSLLASIPTLLAITTRSRRRRVIITTRAHPPVVSAAPPLNVQLWTGPH